MFKVLDEVCEPKRATKYSAYVDLFSREDVVIGAGETKVIKLGIKLDTSTIQMAMAYDSMEMREFMQSHYLEVALRSSLAIKGLNIANSIGIIDLDYPDEIGLIVHSPVVAVRIVPIVIGDDNYYIGDKAEVEGYGDFTRGEYHIKKGDKVAQCTLKEHKGYLMGYESDVVRNGGFGSTGA